MTVRGRVKRRVLVQPPCRGAVVAAVDRALLCQDRADGLLAIAVSSGKVRARLPGAFPFGTHGSVVASCDSACRRVEVADLATGRRSAVAPPKGARYVGGYDGAFSPDGAVLAVPVATRNHDAEHGPPGSLQVALVDLTRNSARLIAGSRLAADYRKLTWSSGRELFFGSGRGRIMSYRVGWPRARLLPVKLGAPILDLAAN